MEEGKDTGFFIKTYHLASLQESTVSWERVGDQLWNLTAFNSSLGLGPPKVCLGFFSAKNMLSLSNSGQNLIPW